MTPETPAPHEPEPPRPRNDPPFGAQAAASVERSLTHLGDPDDALRLLSCVERGGAAFAAYLMLTSTNLAAENIEDTFHDSYIDAWEHFHQFRADILEGLGWADALQGFLTAEGIPADNLTWNHSAIDRQILDVYDVVHLDGWWHIFQK